MGWLNMGQSDQEIIIGDGTLDIVTEMIFEFAKEYQEDLGRKPTLSELASTIKLILGVYADEYFDGCDEIEIVDVKIATKKRRKKQKYQDGDFFAIPLPGKKYAFGRLLDSKEGNYGFFNIISDKIESIDKLKQIPYAFIIPCADDGITSWRWKIIGNMKFAEGEYVEPEFWVRDALDETKAQIYWKGKCRKATLEEASKLEILRIWTPERVEERILQTIKQP